LNKLLSTPLLPASRVTGVAISAEYKNVIDSLNRIGIDCLEVEVSENLDSSVSSHADCRIIQLSDNFLICEEGLTKKLSEFIHIKTEKNVKLLTNRGEQTFKLISDSSKNYIYIINEKVSSPYPYDVKLNAKVINDKILCNSKYVSRHISSFAQFNNIDLIHSNQGYSACSTVLLNNNEILTDDASIHSAVHRMEILTTILRKGEIKLKDCNYGFIGGCCGFIDKNVLAFTGRLNSLSDKQLIKDVLNKKGISYVELTDEEMFDIGGIIPLTEYE